MVILYLLAAAVIAFAAYLLLLLICSLLVDPKKAYPQANITAVDYDPGASEVNQLNRIKLMLSAANIYL